MKQELIQPMELGMISLIGDKIPAAGWYGPTQGMHTIAIRTMNFRGRVFVEASMVSEPTDNDWFTVLPNGVSYLEFPIVPSTSPNVTGESTCYGFNFQYNCLWVRARMDRTYLVPSNTLAMYLAQYGLIDSIVMIF